MTNDSQSSMFVHILCRFEYNRLFIAVWLIYGRQDEQQAGELWAIKLRKVL